MIALNIYMAGVIIMMIAFAIRTTGQDIAPAVLLSVFWPLSILAMIILKGLWTIGWDIDIVSTNKWFHYRKPTNPEVRGFAINIFKLEFQFWQKRKI